MSTVKMHEAKSQLSRLVARVEAGEEIILARGDKPVARIVPMETQKKQPRKPGTLKHLGVVIPDAFFFDPLPEVDLLTWEGTDSFLPGDESGIRRSERPGTSKKAE